MPLPPLADFLRWLRDLPAPFKSMPARFPGGRVRVRAVVADLFETLFAEPPGAEWLRVFEPASAERIELNRLRWVLAACWLLWHPAFRALPLPPAGLRKLLNQGLAELGAVTPAERLDADEERREELVRRALAALGLRLPGESERDAEDRLAQVDSVERRKLEREAVEREKRARAVQEEMRRRAEQEAASKASRE